MANFLTNKVWSEEDWKIFFYNIDLLRAVGKLNKGEFSKEIGVYNIYRRDKNRKRVDKNLLWKICQKFNITEDWLSTDRQFTPKSTEPGDFVSEPEATAEKEMPVEHYKLLVDLLKKENNELKTKLRRYESSAGRKNREST